MQINSKQNEFATRGIIKHNISAVTPGKHINFILYRKWKRGMLVLRSKYNSLKSKLIVTHIVNDFLCTVQSCFTCHKPITYIRNITTPLSICLICHLSQQSSSNNHLLTRNFQKPLKKILVDNKRILFRSYTAHPYYGCDY